MVKKKRVTRPDKFIDDTNKEIDSIIAEARAKRKWYRRAIDFFREVLTKRVAFAILRMFNHKKPKKEKTMNNEKTKKQAKKPVTVKVSLLVPYAIITAIAIAVAGIWVGVNYEKSRVAEINAAVQEVQVSKENQ